MATILDTDCNEIQGLPQALHDDGHKNALQRIRINLWSRRGETFETHRLSPSTVHVRSSQVVLKAVFTRYQIVRFITV